MRIWGRLEVSLLLAGIRYQSGMRGFPEQRLEARLVRSGTPPPHLFPHRESQAGLGDLRHLQVGDAFLKHLSTFAPGSLGPSCHCPPGNLPQYMLLKTPFLGGYFHVRSYFFLGKVSWGCPL